MIDVNWKPGKRELRQFAAMWIVFFGLIGAVAFYRGGWDGTASSWWLATAIVGLPGLAIPGLLRPVYLLWMLLAFPIGWTISHLSLAAIFYLIITPIGLVMRLFGHDPMERKFEPDAATYWIEHRTGDNPSTYFRQF